MMPNNFNKLFEIADNFINQYYSMNHEYEFDSSSYEAVVDEYRSFMFKGPRQFGHTTTAHMLFLKYNAVFVTKTDYMARRLYKTRPDRRVVTEGSDIRNFRGLAEPFYPYVIIVDNASLIDMDWFFQWEHELSSECYIEFKKNDFVLNKPAPIIMLG